MNLVTGNCPHGYGGGFGCPRCPQTAAVDPSYSQPFSHEVAKLTQERGSIYGPPKVDFDRAARLKAVVAECKDPLARHAMEMICVKLARLINSPDHVDSWNDIGGYAKCGLEVTR